jgi:hypothetical protein
MSRIGESAVQDSDRESCHCATAIDIDVLEMDFDFCLEETVLKGSRMHREWGLVAADS